MSENTCNLPKGLNKSVALNPLTFLKPMVHETAWKKSHFKGHRSGFSSYTLEKTKFFHWVAVHHYTHGQIEHVHVDDELTNQSMCSAFVVMF